MADDLRGTWKETGIGLGHAFRDLGKTLVKSVAHGAQKATEWASEEDEAKETPAPSEKEDTVPTTEAKELSD